MTEKDISTFCPKDRKDWRHWLEKNHQTSQPVWLIFYKTSSEKFNLSWVDAVEEALCFGWIDSTKKAIDHEKYRQYFCKRKPKSNWSKINKQKVQELISAGLMTKAGLESIEVAKQNGSWTILDTVEELIIPDDLEKEFKSSKGSEEFFEFEAAIKESNVVLDNICKTTRNQKKTNCRSCPVCSRKKGTKTV